MKELKTESGITFLLVPCPQDIVKVIAYFNGVEVNLNDYTLTKSDTKLLGQALLEISNEQA